MNRGNKGLVVYITPEIAIHPSIPTYSGGLGFLAGSVALSAKKLNIPLIIFSLLYRKGYYTQGLDCNGMVIKTENHTYDVLESTGVKFPLDICRTSTDVPPVWVEVLKLSGEKYNSVDVYFLTTDLEENNYLSRLITDQLYAGNIDRRIAQSIILGKGTVEACKRLGIEVYLYHVNESHGALALVELQQFMSADQVSSKVVFTTHTPVAVGNPKYPVKELSRMSGYSPALLKQCGGEPFNMAAAGIKLSRMSNAVSRKHLEVCREMWHWVFDGAIGLFDERFTYITNGVYRDYWQYPEFVNANTVSEIRAVKQVFTRRMLDFIRSSAGKYFGENILTIVWARRFAEYKRPKLVFDYLNDWIYEMLRNNKIQLIYAGKPHPEDQAMIDVWNDIYRRSLEIPNLAIIPGYDLEMSKILKAGAHLWLNTPRVPIEACGTSGMSARMNGAVLMSTYDGWVCEADENSFFPFGSKIAIGYGHDAFDAESLKHALEYAINVFQNRQDDWYHRAINGKIESEDRWTSDRMIREYAQRMYSITV